LGNTDHFLISNLLLGAQAIFLRDEVEDVAADQSDKLMQMPKPMPVNEPNVFTVAFSQSDGRDFGGTMKTREARHQARTRAMWSKRTTHGSATFSIIIDISPIYAKTSFK
jgi:hypothetical protein